MHLTRSRAGASRGHQRRATVRRLRVAVGQRFPGFFNVLCRGTVKSAGVRRTQHQHHSMSRTSDFIQSHAENPTPIMKAMNWIAAILGVGTFLQIVNLAVGVLSACWLVLQAYGYWKYELPIKRERHRRIMAGQETAAGDPGIGGAD